MLLRSCLTIQIWRGLEDFRNIEFFKGEKHTYLFRWSIFEVKTFSLALEFLVGKACTGQLFFRKRISNLSFVISVCTFVLWATLMQKPNQCQNIVYIQCFKVKMSFNCIFYYRKHEKFGRLCLRSIDECTMLAISITRRTNSYLSCISTAFSF